MVVVHGLGSHRSARYDEGHGFANPDNSMAFLAVTEKFLAQHIGGRYQEDVPERLQKIIDEVTVDVGEVEI